MNPQLMCGALSYYCVYTILCANIIGVHVDWTFCLIRVGYHLQLRNAITFYSEYQVNPNNRSS